MIVDSFEFLRILLQALIVLYTPGLLILELSVSKIIWDHKLSELPNYHKFMYFLS